MSDASATKELAPWVVSLGKNPSYINSLKVTAKRLVFYAPLDIYHYYRGHITGLLMVLFMFTVGVLQWPIVQLFLIAAGLLGFVNDPNEDEDEDKVG